MNKPSIFDYGEIHHNPQSSSPDLFNQLSKRQKPQIESIPGVLPKERKRYQIKVGEQVIATNLSIDEALQVAKGGES